MRYSLAFKQSVLRRVLPPNNESVVSISEELGVTANSIYLWIKKAGNDTLDRDGEVAPNKRGPREKFRLLLESKGIDPEKQGEWLRERGLHSEHLTQYEQELREIVEDKNEKQKEENKRLKEQVKELQKELRRKDKALAETAALLTLKKKAAEIWGDDEDE